MLLVCYESYRLMSNAVSSSSFLPNEVGSRRPLGQLDPLPLESVRMHSLVLDTCMRGLQVKGCGWSRMFDSRGKVGGCIVEVPVLCSYQ